jgi:hypothetical protein
MQDIEGLLAAHPEADVVAVRQWVSEFGKHVVRDNAISLSGVSPWERACAHD